jgi:hypothetical protein
LSAVDYGNIWVLGMGFVDEGDGGFVICCGHGGVASELYARGEDKAMMFEDEKEASVSPYLSEG